MARLTARTAALIQSSRVAHLATADANGAPHLIPICFAFDGERFYSALDRKPKRTSPTRLKRVRNILSNPNVALVIDHYEEEWRRLWYVLITGVAQLIHEGEEHRQAVVYLKEKYPQYRDMDIDRTPVIRITASRITCWGNVPRSANGEGIQSETI